MTNMVDQLIMMTRDIDLVLWQTHEKIWEIPTFDLMQLADLFHKLHLDNSNNHNKESNNHNNNSRNNNKIKEVREEEEIHSLDLVALCLISLVIVLHLDPVREETKLHHNKDNNRASSNGHNPNQGPSHNHNHSLSNKSHHEENHSNNNTFLTTTLDHSTSLQCLTMIDLKICHKGRRTSIHTNLEWITIKTLEVACQGGIIILSRSFHNVHNNKVNKIISSSSNNSRGSSRDSNKSKMVRGLDSFSLYNPTLFLLHKEVLVAVLALVEDMECSTWALMTLSTWSRRVCSSLSRIQILQIKTLWITFQKFL